jgi:hypothetical protein
MRQGYGWVFAVMAVCAVAGCGRGGGGYQAKQVETIEPARVGSDIGTLFPMAEGNQWTYTIETQIRRAGQEGSGSDEVTLRVAKSEQTSEGVRATIEVVRSGEVVEKQVWLSNDTGIYQIAAGKEIPFTSPQPVVVAPVEPGQTFSWKGSGLLPGGQTGGSTIENIVRGPQEVDTDLGRMSGIAVESRFTATDGSGAGTSMIWFAPGVGIVRFKQQAQFGNDAHVQLLRLKSHSLKK